MWLTKSCLIEAVQDGLKTNDNLENDASEEDQEDPTGFIVAVIKNATEIADRGDVSPPE
jgi:hypothetical protein